MFRALSRISSVVEHIGMHLIGIYAALSFIVVCVEVYSRTFNMAVSWTEELSRWLLVGICFVGSSVALKHKKHVGITGVIKLIPGIWKKIILLPTYILIIAFLGYLFYYGLKLTIDQAWQTGAVLMVSMVFVRANIPLGALFMLIHMLYYTVLLFKDPDPSASMIVE